MNEQPSQEHSDTLVELREACSDYARLDDELTALTNQRDALRSR